MGEKSRQLTPENGERRRQYTVPTSFNNSTVPFFLSPALALALSPSPLDCLAAMAISLSCCNIAFKRNRLPKRNILLGFSVSLLQHVLEEQLIAFKRNIL